MFGGLLLFIGPGVTFKLRALYTLGKYSTAGLYPELPCFFFFKICYLFFIICRHVCLHVGVCVHESKVILGGQRYQIPWGWSYIWL